MAASKNYGSSRVVVGAGYGVKDFLAQRLTAVILAIYTIVLLVGALAMPAF
ncbi:MAG: succinate dehydrogenase, hydrophobic membrane anchor protein, partial [Alcaligenaceae bacterium]